MTIDGKRLAALAAPRRFATSPAAAEELPSRGEHTTACTTRYGATALENECAAVASAPAGTRNEQLNRSTFAVAQLIAGGEVHEGDASGRLTAAGQAAGLSAREVEATIQSALRAGKAQPRRAVLRSVFLGAGSNESVKDARTTSGGEGPGSSARAVSAPLLVCLADVEPQPVRWLWSERIPLGKLTVVDGDPGLGKSILTLDLAARVSRGADMPDGTKSGIGGSSHVLLLNIEDDPADTIRPRLDAADADPTRIVLLTGQEERRGERMAQRAVTLADVEVLEAAIAKLGAVLVIVDPLMAFLPHERDSHRDQDVRGVLGPLAVVAQRTGAAVVVVRHLNKAGNGNPLYRGGGSIGIIGAARSGLLVAKDPDDPEGERRILAMTKANLVRAAPALAYRIAVDGSTARVSWGGPTEHTADALLGPPVPAQERSRLVEAREFIAEVLTNGPVLANDLQAQASTAGIHSRTFERARAGLSKEGVIRRTRPDLNGPWWWEQMP